MGWDAISLRYSLVSIKYYLLPNGFIMMETYHTTCGDPKIEKIHILITELKSHSIAATQSTTIVPANGEHRASIPAPAPTTSQRSSTAFLAGKNMKFYFRTKHRTRKNSSVS